MAPDGTLSLLTRLVSLDPTSFKTNHVAAAKLLL